MIRFLINSLFCYTTFLCTLGIIFRHFRIYFFCIPAFQQIQPDFSPLHLIGLTISCCLKMQKTEPVQTVSSVR